MYKLQSGDLFLNLNYYIIIIFINHNRYKMQHHDMLLTVLHPGCQRRRLKYSAATVPVTGTERHQPAHIQETIQSDKSLLKIWNEIETS